jgi:hypothetical protein
MTNGKKVYVAGPYTRPDPCLNTNRAVHIAEELVAAGYVPFIPHLTHFWHTMVPHTYQFWLDYDMHWLQSCDAVLRFPGESSGADKEVVEADWLGIPVFHSIEELAGAIK